MSVVNSVFKNIVLIFTSMLPMLENRGSIIIAAAMRVKWKSALIFTTTGNFLPMPFLIYKSDTFFEKLKDSKFVAPVFNKVNGFLDVRTDKFKKNAVYALAIIIGVPFTGIGAWGGFLIANILKLDKKKASIAIFIGIFISGLITTLCTYGIVSAIIN